MFFPLIQTSKNNWSMETKAFGCSYFLALACQCLSSNDVNVNMN